MKKLYVDRPLAVLVMLTSVLLTSDAQTLQSCIPNHCSCPLSNTTATPAQPFNADVIDWRPVVLATALGLLTSTLVMTSMAVWWTWKTSNNITDASSVQSVAGRRRPNQNTRSVSPSVASGDSWATPRNTPPMERR